jgi:hypothetical protein
VKVGSRLDFDSLIKHLSVHMHDEVLNILGPFLGFRAHIHFEIKTHNMLTLMLDP